MVDHVKKITHDDKPDHFMLDTRTNDLRSEKTVNQIAKSITELAMSLKDNDNSGIVSDIVPRHDNLINKVTLHEKCPNTEFFLVRIFAYLD